MCEGCRLQSAGQNNSFTLNHRQRSGGFDHTVGPVSNKNAVARGGVNALNNVTPIFVGHIEAINLHELLNHKVKAHPHTLKKWANNGIAYFVIALFIEINFIDSAARGEYREFHT